ncbi:MULTISPECIES: ornithine cyclodeaminase [Pseudoalteromonas]|uniref:ornithine cyclodeaminase n=1 Tax=Pseudoalteromonas TaxID=53246 RepID=UPI0005F9B75C|nr:MULTISPECIES: ornithine cyclodeaminase [Pseudoalteromonas]KJY97562.1 ornithine cyclodeaminase [Pseudoalteromonas piscicida]ODB44978.1 ornithine cyclodeaminase [Pseudoalteromonas sp. BMB]
MTQQTVLPILNEARLAQLDFPYSKVIEVVENAFRSLHHPDSANPLKVIMTPQDGRSIAYSMAGRDAASNTVGFKVVYEYDPDRSRNQYQFYSFIFLCDDATGHPVALMDVKELGPMRTSATSALFAKYAVHSDAKNALVVGTGVQGQIALPMLVTALPQLTHLTVHGSYQTGLEAVQQKLKEHHPQRQVAVSQDLEASVRQADVILAVTGLSAKENIKYEWLKPGAVVILVGYGIEKPVLHRADRLLTTDAEQMKVTGDDLLDENGKLPAVDATLTEILNDEKPARTHPDEIIFVYNSGMIITDVALGRAVADFAITQGNVEEVTLW